jgi:hypothetical protein
MPDDAGFDNPQRFSRAHPRIIAMRPFHRLLALSSVALLAACSTVMPAAPSGFLTANPGLVDSGEGGLSALRTAVPIDRTQAAISAVEWRVDPRADISSEEQAALIEVLRAELRSQLQQLDVAPKGRPVVLRAAITKVETVSPALNAVGTLLLIGPLDRGGAATEIEALDAESGRQLAAIRLGYFAPLTDIGARFSKLAPAEIAVKKAAADFARMLVPAATPVTAAR